MFGTEIAGDRVIRTCHTMFNVITAESLHVLVVFAGQHSDSPALASGLRGHCTLVCESETQALESIAIGFSPDVVFIDGHFANAPALTHQIASLVPERAIEFVVMSRSSESAREAEFSHWISYPVAGCEVAQLLWRIQMKRDVQKAMTDWAVKAV